MQRRTTNEEGIGNVLQTIIAKNNLQGGIDKVNVAQAWKNLMGSGVNAYTKDIILKGSTLYVALSSSVLREELSYGKDKIIKLINEDLGRAVITNVVLR